ncbi:caspase family protein [Nocardia sp. NPDC004604]|uniref:caspase, EACC1-associated type n=1 Tax=Nocardia sp. NPDC004604 TaxID=3157013 RepID=UPI0033B56F8F
MSPSEVAEPRISALGLSSSGTRVLLVGCGSFVDGSALPDVPSAAATITDLAHALTGRCGVRPENVTTVVDPPDPMCVDTALVEAAQQASDVLVFYYVGHGLLSAGNSLYLATQATQNLTELRYKAFPFQAVREIVGDCPARSIVVVMDCCFAGRARGSVAATPTEALQLTTTGGTYLLTAASATQQALAPEGARHSAFTGALLKLLDDGDAAEPAMITLDSAYRHLQRLLPRHNIPAPRRHTSGNAGELILARNPATAVAIPRVRISGIDESGVGDAPCPYRGLDAYTAQDARYFHGRADLTAEILDELADFTASDGPVMMVGVSGVGKSSLLQAGLLPAIGRGELPVPGSQRWPHLTMTPGEHPVATLAARLRGHHDHDALAAELRTDATQLGAIITEAVRDLAPEGPARRLLLVIDQFEELFTACTDEEERQTFVTAVCSAAGSAAVVIVCLRADFYPHCLAYPPLFDAVKNRQIPVTAMPTEQLRMAVEEPARIAGLTLEEGLTDRLLHDAAGGRDPAAASLPLLSYALQLTWARRENSLLTLAGYQATGGIWDAVTRQADLAYDGLTPHQQRAARTLLLRMVHIGTDTDDTCRAVDLTTLTAEFLGDTTAFDAVRDALAARRLITVDDNAVARLSHDALLRAWTRLRRWIDEDRNGLLLRQQLADDAQQWRDSDRDPSRLYRGARLATVEAHIGHAQLGTVTTEFLTASRIERHRLHRRSVITRSVLAMLLVVAVTVSIVATIGFRAATTAQHRADASARRAVVEKLRSQAAAMLAQDQPGGDIRAIKQVLAAHALSPDPETVDAMIDIRYRRRYLQKVIPTSNVVHGVAVSPDGTRIASGGDRSIRLSDTRTGRQIDPPLAGHTAAVTSVAFSHDGALLVSASRDNTVRIWHTGTGRQIGEPLSGHTAWVNSVAFSPDDTRIASGSDDGTIRIWDASTGHQIGPPIAGQARSVNSIAFTPDGTHIATGNADGTVSIWDSRTGERLQVVSATAEGSVETVAFSPDGTRIASGSDDGTIRIWDASTGSQIGPPLGGDLGIVFGVAFSPDGNYLASGSSDSTVRVWDPRTGQAIGSPLIGDTASVFSVVFSPDGTHIASGSWDSTIRIWDLPIVQQLDQPIPGELDAVATVAFSPDGTRLATGNADNGVWLWDPHTGHALDQLNDNPDIPGPVNSLDFTRDGKRIVSGSADTTIRVWDIHTLREIGPPLTGHDDQVSSVAFSPDDTRIASGSWDRTIRTWDVHTGQEIGPQMTGHTDRVYSVAFSPDGTRLASASGDSTVRIWDAQTGQQLGAPLKGHTGVVLSVAFSPDGTRIASSSSDDTIRIWDTRTGQQIGPPLTGHKGFVRTVSFSPDGFYLASGGADHTVRLWDARTGRQLGPPLTGDTAPLWGVAFNPDTTLLATAGGTDGQVRLWPIYRPVPEGLCTILTSNITPGEWNDWVSPDIPYIKLCPDLPG